MRIHSHNPGNWMDSMLGGMMESAFAAPSQSDSIAGYDVERNDDEVIVTADIPGVEPGDIDVWADDDSLTVVVDTERTTGSSQRHVSRKMKIPLQAAVNAEKASGTLRNGVLSVTLPRLAEEEEATRVEISGGEDYTGEIDEE